MHFRNLLLAASVATTAALLAGLAPAAARPVVPRAAGVAVPTAAVRKCAFTRDLYSEPRSQLLACGYRFLQRSAVRRLPGGGSAYLYHQDGHLITFPVPPEGFNVVTATSAQLREYSLPGWRVLGGKRHWDRIMSNVRFTAPPMALIEGPGQASVKCSSDNTGCWAGYIDKGHSNYNLVEANYHEPHIGSNSCSDHLAESVWVGLGGWNAKHLSQDGTSYGVASSPHHPFYELTPSKMVFPTHWAAKPGDLIKAITLWNPTTHRFAFTVIDGSQEMNLSASGAYVGRTADFVLENPTLSSGRAELENVGTVSFTNAYAFYGSGGQHSVGSLPHMALTSRNDNTGDILAQPASITGRHKQNFKVTQRHCD